MIRAFNIFIQKIHRVLFWGHSFIFICSCNKQIQQAHSDQNLSHPSTNNTINIVSSIPCCNNLPAAAQEGHKDCMRDLIINRANLNQLDNNGLTPLYLVAYHGHASCIQYLIENGANVNQKDKKRQTPLHLAVRQNNTSYITTLINGGADVNLQDHGGLTPLDLAIARKYSNCINLLQANGGNVGKQQTS
ncbi:MAG: ankyrin repeat domain-containing protein [Candidatus Cardinium sp.]|nr:ankyrin repeat domain-containing protein [Candidatus Cardinium sp.]